MVFSYHILVAGAILTIWSLISPLPVVGVFTENLPKLLLSLMIRYLMAFTVY